MKQDNGSLQNIVIGIGAQKSATTWLFMCLDEHPAICTVPSKEVHFFSYQDRFEKGIGWYEERFVNCTNNVPKLEISTSYLSNKIAISRIAQLYPHAKIIVSLRNPVDRAISHIRHLQSKGLVNEVESVMGIISKYPEIIENGMYGKHLAHVFDNFDRGQVHVVLYDDIYGNEQKIISDIYKFLGVKEDFKPKSLHFRVNSAELRFSSLYKKINRLYLRIIKYYLGRLLVRVLKKTGLRAHKLSRFIKTDNGSARFKKEIDFYQYFREDINLLEKLLKEDLSVWKA